MALAKASDAVSIATLVIAGIAGVGLGGIIVALINTRQERERQLRESMLTAADEFLRAAVSALSHLRALHPSAREINLGLIGLFAHGRAKVESSADLEDSPGLQAAELKKADALLDEAKDRLARVRLLFSPDSRVAEDGELFLRASAMASGLLKAYYALGQLELVEKVQRRQARVRNLGEIADFNVPIPLGGIVLPIPIAAVTGLISGAFDTLSDVGKARAKTEQNAQQSLQEADAAIASFTRHAWEGLRKPSWKPRQPGHPVQMGNDVASSTEITRTPSVERPASDASPTALT